MSKTMIWAGILLVMSGAYAAIVWEIIDIRREHTEFRQQLTDAAQRIVNLEDNIMILRAAPAKR